MDNKRVFRNLDYFNLTHILNVDSDRSEVSQPKKSID
jgi:hypothetical protein